MMYLKKFNERKDYPRLIGEWEEKDYAEYREMVLYLRNIYFDKIDDVRVKIDEFYENVSEIIELDYDRKPFQNIRLGEAQVYDFGIGGTGLLFEEESKFIQSNLEITDKEIREVVSIKGCGTHNMNGKFENIKRNNHYPLYHLDESFRTPTDIVKEMDKITSNYNRYTSKVGQDIFGEDYLFKIKITNNGFNAKDKKTGEDFIYTRATIEIANIKK